MAIPLKAKMSPSHSRVFNLIVSLLILWPRALRSFPLGRIHSTGWTTTRTSVRFSSPEHFVPDVEVVTSMPEPLPANLKNTYYMLRHGQSTANVQGIISSARTLAYSSKHGLTQLGYDQGRLASHQLLDLIAQVGKGERIIMISSPFARARQTAQACLDGLVDECSEQVQSMGIRIQTEIQLEDRLMERYFGRLDDEAIYTYAYVWPVDKFNVTHTAFGVESVAAVATRLREVVLSLEETYSECHLVLVSHADVLQICQLYAANVENVGMFSSYRFVNGEVRIMKRTPNSLPEPSPLQAPKRGT